MTKIVYNACYGGFSLSAAAIRMYLDLKGFKYKEKPTKYSFTEFEVEGWDNFYDRRIERDDPILVEVVEKLGDKASGSCAKLRVEDIPKGTLYRIDEYDGYESIETKDDIEWKVA